MSHYSTFTAVYSYSPGNENRHVDGEYNYIQILAWLGKRYWNLGKKHKKIAEESQKKVVFSVFKVFKIRFAFSQP